MLAAPALAADPGRIDGYVTPYYNSAGPVIKVGQYSAGLASKDSSEFVATILRMKQRMRSLDFAETYVAAIRLYDLGYRREATYWFYTAQYKGRQFALLADQKRLGGMGDPGFELYHAQEAFFAVVGPNINGYAFGDIGSLVAIIRRVQNENESVPDLQTAYPGVNFVPRPQWQRINAGLNAGLGQLASQLVSQKSRMARERAQNGTAARFAHLTSKPFPG
ncbi:MAG: hypothetical protein JO190_00590 [Candidatus Eremiobacteraeota bacterium]|nr:hypothetical protein [Candidatus Eremiobacteraeota bacterium]MBV8498048.1 hypothetical protein [Candidatus Eremiobacteraeota bacterium]